MSNFKADNYCTKMRIVMIYGRCSGHRAEFIGTRTGIDRKCADEYEKIARIKGYNQIKVLMPFVIKEVALCICAQLRLRIIPILAEKAGGAVCLRIRHGKRALVRPQS